MSDPFIGEVRIFAGNFAPRGWAFCNGQLLPIEQNTALFSILGTNYGGDGRRTFGIPDLQGRAPMHPGRGPGLTNRRLGQKVGAETITLNSMDIPAHAHAIKADKIDRSPAESNDPSNRILGATTSANYKTASFGNLVRMSNQALSSAGGGQSHNNMQPFLAINFVIALQGLYPSRS
ncbi:MAG: tail fiber protein [Cyanobacteria bacterium J06642_11]